MLHLQRLQLRVAQHRSAGRAPQPPAPRFKSGVDVVEVAVLARDAGGKPVTDLAREEITVLEDGVPQPLVAFERISLPSRPALAVPVAGAAGAESPRTR